MNEREDNMGENTSGAGKRMPGEPDFSGAGQRANQGADPVAESGVGANARAGGPAKSRPISGAANRGQIHWNGQQGQPQHPGTYAGPAEQPADPAADPAARPGAVPGAGPDAGPSGAPHGTDGICRSLRPGRGAEFFPEFFPERGSELVPEPGTGSERGARPEFGARPGARCGSGIGPEPGST